MIFSSSLLTTKQPTRKSLRRIMRLDREALERGLHSKHRISRLVVKHLLIQNEVKSA